MLQTYQEEEEFLAVWKAADMSLVESWALKVVEFLSTQTWVGTSPNSLIDNPNSQIIWLENHQTWVGIIMVDPSKLPH